MQDRMNDSKQSTQRITSVSKGRNLLEELKNLIFELVELEADVAKIDVSDRMTSVRRVKKGMLLHIKTATKFKKKIDSIRKDIIIEKEKSVTN